MATDKPGIQETKPAEEIKPEAVAPEVLATPEAPLPNHQEAKIPEGAQPVVDTSLDKEIGITFKKSELIVLMNLINGNPQMGGYRTFTLAQSEIILPILRKIEPLVVALSDKDLKPAETPAVPAAPEAPKPELDLKN